MRTLLTLIALVLVYAVPAQSQTTACPTSTAVTVNPNGTLCVTPATDYMANTTLADGTSVPVVVRLELLLFGPSVTDTATGTPTQTINLGKPTRNAAGAVWTSAGELAMIPVGQQYKARVVAIGQPASAGGPAQVSGRSPESNPFIRPAPVPAPLAPLGISVPGS